MSQVTGSPIRKRTQPLVLTTEALGRPISFSFVPALDGLRAIAVTGVMLYHGGAPLAGGGFLGVNVFFVLSGFLITSLLLGEWTKRLTIRLGQFWTRRARPPRRVRQPAARLAVDPLLRGQLALHLRRGQLLLPDRPALPGVAHVVAGDRGAVLHRVAAGGAGL